MRVTPCQPFQPLCAAVARINPHRPLGPAEGHIHDGALDGHEGGQGFDFIFVGIRAIADAAFHRQFVVAMLDAPGLNYLDIASGARQRKFKPVDAVATLDLIQQPRRVLGEGGGSIKIPNHIAVKALVLS